jgi:hypothetical protein
MAGNANSGGWNRTPAQCSVCGAWCEGTRRAYRHCQQKGLQRVAGFIWRGHETPQRRLERRMAELRADPFAMREIHELAWVLAEWIGGEQC